MLFRSPIVGFGLAALCQGVPGAWGGHTGNLAGQREAKPTSPSAPRVPGGEPLVSKCREALSRGDPLRLVLGVSPGSPEDPLPAPWGTHRGPLPLLQPSLWAKEEPSQVGSTVLQWTVWD